MENQFERTEMLLGTEAMDKLKYSHIAVFGVGGVGGYVCEALVRSGIEHFDLVDNDTVSLTNLNRQIIATHDTINQSKVEVAKQRMLSINPNAKINTIEKFLLPENIDGFPFEYYDYIVDAIDTVTAKIALIQKAKELNIPIISSMGTGNKLDPTKLTITDISKTTMDPLARVMRRELRKRGINKLKVVYSTEEPKTPLNKQEQGTERKRDIPGSTAFVPPVAGFIIASEVIKDITKS